MLGLVVVLVAGLLMLAPVPAPYVERHYTNGLYAAVQPGITALSNAVPFAVLDLLLAAAVILTPVVLVRAWRQAGRGMPRRLFSVAWRATVCAASIYLAFLGTWGLNYRRVPAEQRARVDPARVTAAAVSAFAREARDQVNRLASGADGQTLPRGALVDRLRPAFQAAGRRLGREWTVTLGIPKSSAVARALPLAGVDGMTNPFGLEVLLNPRLVPVEEPFVLAHEWAHLAGHADEADASYVAWLTCLGGTPADRYSGWLSLFLLASRQVPDSERGRLTRGLSAPARGHIAAISERLSRAHPVVRAASWRAYDQYLRANRVESGVARYDEVLRLVIGSAPPEPSRSR